MATKLYLGILLALAVLGLWWNNQHQGGLRISNDSYQYLDAASNLANNACGCTRLAHFDEQVAAGQMPVPFTHFPLGYPLLIAGLSKTGLSLEMSAYFWSAASYILALWLLWSIALELGAKPLIAAGFSLLWIFHDASLAYGSTVGTEAPITALILWIALLIIRDSPHYRERPMLLMGIGIGAAAAYWIRYAGLFLIPVAAAYLVWVALRRPASRFSALVSLAIMTVLMVVLQVRNFHYSGTWRGGFASGAGHSLREVIVDTLKVIPRLLFGDSTPIRLDPWFILLFICVLIAGWFAIRTLVTSKGSLNAPMPPAIIWLSLLCAVYIAGITLAALTSIAADLRRYYLPLYPLVLAVSSALVSRIEWPRRVASCALAVALVSVLSLQSHSVLAPAPTAPHVEMQQVLASEVQPGLTANQWLLSHTAPEEVIFSVHGQPLHYLLQRPVVSVINPNYTARKDDGPGYRKLMGAFQARYLIVFSSGTKIEAPEQTKNPFLSQLASSDAGSPDWLTVVARSPELIIFECGSCKPPSQLQ